ncbi:hypothetical protein K1T71_004839 [Dendrolimus kikuchii]|uniref:Uncharacterized protein n=1 Tax=Dendrolimus kikuchii TaxID=765133 RepID=A0ACC1D6G5_9NEOP|nr:hypothetical protein K1T71_004839 [Dendrolimus kikuchii]
MERTYYLLEILKISNNKKEDHITEDKNVMFWTPRIELTSVANRPKTPFPKTTPVRAEKYESIELTPILRKSTDVKAKVIKKINFDVPVDEESDTEMKDGDTKI